MSMYPQFPTAQESCVVSFCFVEMGYINDDEVPCCSKE